MVQECSSRLAEGLLGGGVLEKARGGKKVIVAVWKRAKESAKVEIGL